MKQKRVVDENHGYGLLLRVQWLNGGGKKILMAWAGIRECSFLLP